MQGALKITDRGRAHTVWRRGRQACKRRGARSQQRYTKHRHMMPSSFLQDREHLPPIAAFQHQGSTSLAPPHTAKMTKLGNSTLSCKMSLKGRTKRTQMPMKTWAIYVTPAIMTGLTRGDYAC